MASADATLSCVGETLRVRRSDVLVIAMLVAALQLMSVSAGGYAL